MLFLLFVLQFHDTMKGADITSTNIHWTKNHIKHTKIFESMRFHTKLLCVLVSIE